MAEEKNFFEELYDVDIRDRIGDNNGLPFFPWAASWAEVCKKHPDATYDIERFGENRLPYTESNLGIMVHTTVTINGVTRPMCLSVMNGAHKAMKSEPYTYTVGKGGKTVEKTVEAATMRDVADSIMRCLAKNCAMFGIALPLWARAEASENILEIEKLRKECVQYINKKCALSAEAKEKVGKLCKDADPDANGDPNLMTDLEVLRKLKKSLLAIRKINRRD